MGIGRCLRDAEDGDDGVGAGDFDFGDQRFNQRFAVVVGAGGDQLGDVVGDAGECSGVGSGGSGGEGRCQLVAAVGQLAASGTKLGEAVADELFVHCAVLERGQVAVDLVVGVGDLDGHG
ncbi:hypothetical protein ACGF5S_06770 [Nocardia nova]|uniref:hypothetical protein n=1 Tax=Nocardia nova TaxID=37330 RepID=UPI00371A079F